MFWLWLWLLMTGGIVIANHISMARGDKQPSRALLEAIIANLIFGALLAGTPRKGIVANIAKLLALRGRQLRASVLPEPRRNRVHDIVGVAVE